MTRTSYPTEMSRWIISYLTTELCPALKIPPVFDEVTFLSEGAKSYSLEVHPRDAAPFLLQCFRNPEQAGERIHNLSLAEASNLPTPRIQYSVRTKLDPKQHRFAVVVEDLIDGEHLHSGQLKPRQITNLAEALARLHSVENAQWGAIRKLRSRNYFDAAIQTKIEHRLDSIAKFDEDYCKEWRTDILRFTQGFRKDWDGGPPFALTHQRMNSEKVVFTPDERVFFVDVESFQFGAAGKDLTAALHSFCTPGEQEQQLKQLYFSLGPRERAVHYNKFEPLYRIWHHLHRWASRSQHLYGRKKSGQGDLEGLERSRQRERGALWEWMGRG